MAEKSKTSKNNPNARKGGNKVMFQGKEVRPFKFNNGIREYMAAEYTDGATVKVAGEVLPWGVFSHLDKS